MCNQQTMALVASAKYLTTLARPSRHKTCQETISPLHRLCLLLLFCPSITASPHPLSPDGRFGKRLKDGELTFLPELPITTSFKRTVHSSPILSEDITRELMFQENNYRDHPLDDTNSITAKRKNGYTNHQQPFSRMFHLHDYYNTLRTRQMKNRRSTSTGANRQTEPFLPLTTFLKGNNQNSGSKRNVFFSRGWGASGRPQEWSNPTSERRIAEEINEPIEKVQYAFTSNHWGPLGKRSLH